MVYKSKITSITTGDLARTYEEHRVSEKQYESFLKQFEKQIRNDVTNVLFYQKVEELINEWKKEELGDKPMPFSPEAEIETGLKYFLQWLKSKTV